jgi:hypothetical protein
MSQPVIINPKAGIQRDGTRFDADGYIDGLWTRFQRGKPRKMGGYRNLDDTIGGIGRGGNLLNRGGLSYVHIGTGNGIDQVVLNKAGDVVSYANRTPSGFAASDTMQWQFDVMYDPVVANKAQIVAHATPSIGSIGDATGTAQLTAISSISVSGGILAMLPYLTAFGNDGQFRWSLLNSPSDFVSAGSGEAYVAKQKIIRGLPLRGGPSASPSGLFWSLNGLIRVYYTGGTTFFGFDTLSENTTILSSMSPIEYDGVYFWPGAERFMMFNGAVRELPNVNSFNWFYDNLNQAHSDKIFSFRNTRFGEIWWCFPYQDSTEPNAAVIYNVRENLWYDTMLPGAGRSTAISPQVYRYPLMTGVTPNESSQYKLWQHETGSDEIDGNSTSAVRAMFETNDMCLLKSPNGAQDKRLHIDAVEPDFVQTGEMSVTVVGNANARSSDEEGEQRVFPAPPAAATDQVINFKETRRQLRMRFESNTVGGDFQMGQVVAHIAENGGTRTG